MTAPDDVATGFVSKPVSVARYDCASAGPQDVPSLLASQIQAQSYVLDVGCGMGATIKAYREMVVCRVLGIEPDAERANGARSQGIEVITGLYENGINDEHGPFDVIIFADVLEHLSNPDFPFCLCWANENWSRRWDGLDTQILMKQEYSSKDDEQHGQYLMRVFTDPRYLRVDGKPIFLIYKASAHPNAAELVTKWRKMAKASGIGELFLCNVESTPEEKAVGPLFGFDASVEFAPDWANVPKCNRDYVFWRAAAKIGAKTGIKLPLRSAARHCIFDYRGLVELMSGKPEVDYYRIPCVTPSWDNSARRKQFARIFHGSTPAIYQKWLTTVIKKAKADSRGKGLVFVNAWNEWAEGNHLEPCQKWGRAYLEATRSALQEAEHGINAK